MGAWGINYTRGASRKKRDGLERRRFCFELTRAVFLGGVVCGDYDLAESREIQSKRSMPKIKAGTGLDWVIRGENWKWRIVIRNMLVGGKMIPVLYTGWPIRYPKVV